MQAALVCKREEDVYFRPRHCRELDGGGYHLIESKLLVDIYNEGKVKGMCSEKDNVVLNENQEGRKTCFAYI